MRFTVNGKLNPGEFWSQSKVHRSRAFCPGRCCVRRGSYFFSWPSLNAKISIILSFNFVSRRETCSSSSVGINYTEQTNQIELNCPFFYIYYLSLILFIKKYIYNWIYYYLLKIWKLRTIFRIAWIIIFARDNKRNRETSFLDFYRFLNGR